MSANTAGVLCLEHSCSPGAHLHLEKYPGPSILVGARRESCEHLKGGERVAIKENYLITVS